MNSSAVMSVSDDFVRMNGSDPTATATIHKLGLPERARSDSSGMSDNDEEDDEVRCPTLTLHRSEGAGMKCSFILP